MFTDRVPPQVVDAPLAVVCDVEALLVDRVVGVQQALDAVAREFGQRWHGAADGRELWHRGLADCLLQIVGDADPATLSVLAARYRQHYGDRLRYAAPLRSGARAVLRRIVDAGAEWHFVSTDGPEIATRLVRAFGLATEIAVVYTPPVGICRRARSGLIDHYIAGRTAPKLAHLVVADALLDVFAAHRAGVPTLAMANGETPAEVIAALPLPVGIARNLDEAADWIEAQALARLSLARHATRGRARLH